MRGGEGEGGQEGERRGARTLGERLNLVLEGLDLLRLRAVPVRVLGRDREGRWRGGGGGGEAGYHEVAGGVGGGSGLGHGGGGGGLELGLVRDERHHAAQDPATRALSGKM